MNAISNYSQEPLHYLTTKAMKKALLVIAVALIFSSCGESETEQQDRIMSELECPVILIGKTDLGEAYHKIVVRDVKGRIRTFCAGRGVGGGNGYNFPAAIAQSRQVGDTLKPCN